MNRKGSVWRSWLHQGGAQTMEWVAMGAVVAAMLGAIVFGMQSRGGQIGNSVANVIVSALNGGGAGAAGSSASPSTASQSPGTVTGPVVAVPSIVTAQSQGQNPLVEFWNNLPLWLKGGLIAVVGALVVGVIFVALVAAGIVTVVSFPVALIIAGVGLVVAFVAGAIYAVATGKIDVLELLLLGAGAQLVTIAVGLWIASGAPAAALAWVRSAASAAWGWVSKTAWPWIQKNILDKAGREALENLPLLKLYRWMLKNVPFFRSLPSWLAKGFIKFLPAEIVYAVYAAITALVKGQWPSPVDFLIDSLTVFVVAALPASFIVKMTIGAAIQAVKEWLKKLFAPTPAPTPTITPTPTPTPTITPTPTPTPTPPPTPTPTP